LFEAPESLAELAHVGAALGDELVASEALALAEQLERSELNVLVVGQFKRGKSTLVNALLCEDLMPTGALPLTGVAVAIRYGSSPSIRVQLRDGASRTATPEELAIYVSERTNPNNALGVSRVDIVRPAPALRGIALFDTPGVGSTFRHNTEAARAILPRADAALLVVGPEPPIGAEELAYARDVADSTVRLFVVFNKADLAGDAIDELLTFTQDAIEGAADHAEIHALSATRARDAQRQGQRDSSFDAFVDALRSFVEERGSQTIVTSTRRRARALVERAVLLLRMRAEAVALPQSERERRRALLEAALQTLDDRVRFLELAVDDDVRRLRLRLEDELDRRHDRERPAFVAEAETIARELSRKRRTEALEALLHERALAWRHDAVALAERALAESAQKYVRMLAEIEEAVIRAGCSALHVEVAALEPRDVAFEPAKLTLPVSIDPTTGLEIVRNLVIEMLPGQARTRALRARIARILESELDALRGKLRYGMAHDLEPWRRSVHDTIHSALESTRSAVLAAFPSGLRSEDEERARDAVRALQEQLSRLSPSFVESPG
jgi:predicted GTPase